MERKPPRTWGAAGRATAQSRELELMRRAGIRQADGQELPAFDELRIRPVMGLDIEEEPAHAQDIEDRDDAGSLLVVGEEETAARGEPIGVMLGHDFKGASVDDITPHFADMIILPDV